MEKGETLMFSRLHLSGNDIVRKAEPRFMDGEPGSWVVMDFEDVTGPEWPRTSAFKRLDIASPDVAPPTSPRSWQYFCPRCLWLRGVPAR